MVRRGWVGVSDVAHEERLHAERGGPSPTEVALGEGQQGAYAHEGREEVSKHLRERARRETRGEETRPADVGGTPASFDEARRRIRAGGEVGESRARAPLK